MKTGQLTTFLTNSIDNDLLSHYDGIEWLCPDAPLRLVSDSRYDDGPQDDVEIFGWWRILDFHIQHEHLYRSLEYLAKYLQEHGPVDGIVGFSQGAAVAMMLAALCEDTPQRRKALAAQGVSVSIPPPQAPFKFVVACCGFKNAERYYDGFYSPKITTPSFHVVAEFDTMVSAEQSASLADACEDASVVHFRGTHHVPTDRATLCEMATFIAHACADRSLTSKVESDVMGSLASLSSSSSVSGLSSKSGRTHLRITRRTTFVRRMSSRGIRA